RVTGVQTCALPICTFTVEVPPRGDAPDWVYRAWLGLTLPYTSKDNYTGCIDVVSRKSSQPHEHYYLVPEEVAIKMLEQHDREAAAWWKAHDYPRSESFCFPDQALLF